MSRIGRMPITLPKGVTFEQKDSAITVKGSKGSLTQTFHPNMSVQLDDGILSVMRASESREDRALHGLTRALLNNMVVGVSDGFQKILRIEGVGYRAAVNGVILELSVGYSHPVYFDPPADVSFEVEDRSKTIIVKGIDKQVVGEISAQIRKMRPPEPYKGKGIRYDGEHVRRKAGKAGKV